jgi:hypothetical protein
MASVVSKISIALMVVIISSCGSEPKMQADENALRTLAGQKVFFGHQSVGNDLLDGVREIAKSFPAIPIVVGDARAAGALASPMIAHAGIGRNEAPESKIEEFERILDGPIGDRVEIACMKLCYVDIMNDTDVDTLFDRYREMVSRVKNRHPSIRLAHVTVPVTKHDPLKAFLKSRIKALLGKKSGWEYANLSRNRFNEKILSTYGGIDPVFDLAKFESTRLETGASVEYTHRGQKFPALNPSYARDEGHLNHAGKIAIGNEFIRFLSGISGKAR